MKTAKMSPHLHEATLSNSQSSSYWHKAVIYERGNVSFLQPPAMRGGAWTKEHRGPGSDMSLPGVIPDTASNQTTHICTHMRVRAHTTVSAVYDGPKAHSGCMVIWCYIVTWLHEVKWANLRDLHLEAVRHCAMYHVHSDVSPEWNQRWNLLSWCQTPFSPGPLRCSSVQNYMSVDLHPLAYATVL